MLRRRLHPRERVRRARSCPAARARAHPSFDLWIVPNLNPDGFARGTRQNAHGVDLNRNWGAMWKPIGGPGSAQYSGPRPWSEPETRAARALVERPGARRDDLVPPAAGHRARVGPCVPAARNPRGCPACAAASPWLNGSATNWMNRRFPGTSTYVVEFPAGPLSPTLAAHTVAAVLQSVGCDACSMWATASLRRRPERRRRDTSDNCGSSPPEGPILLLFNSSDWSST